VIEASYSGALMLLLKYPSPISPNGPQTFVDDAIFLRDNLNEAGGAKIISKYSGKAPPTPSTNSRPQTPLGQSTSPTRNLYRTKSPLASPARFLQQQGGVEALIQGAAKGVFDRGERLGINQAVRNAVGEVKKNMQDLQASRSNSHSKGRPSGSMKWSLDEGKSVSTGQAVAVKMSDRNRQLARMLEQAMSDLRVVSVSPDGDKETYIAAIDLAIAKVDFVKVYLEDAAMPLPEEFSAVASTSTVLPDVFTEPSSHDPLDVRNPSAQVSSAVAATEPAAQKPSARFSTSKESSPISFKSENNTVAEVPVDSIPFITVAHSKTSRGESPVRPKAPVPTRSTIAQSSFSWMLEPDTSGSSSSPPKPSSPFLKSSRKPTSGPNREKAAFLFGEDGGEVILPSVRPSPLGDAEEGYNMKTMKGSSTK
jgi:TBC1 domain family protein 5